MRYYSLTFQTPCGEHRVGERLYNAVCPLSISQHNSADIKLPCADDTLPQTLCTILANDDGSSWRLVKTTDYYPVLVNGREVECVTSLQNGDRIEVLGITLKFHIHNDDKYVEGAGIVAGSAGIQPRTMGLFAMLMLLATVAITVGYSHLSKRMCSFTTAENEAIAASVCKIVVDRYALQMHTPDCSDGVYVTVDSVDLDSISVGTCFFTTDSLCVTARHCVEPWLDFDQWTDNPSQAMLPQHIRWAVMAERSQEECADTLYRLVSHCQVLRPTADGDQPLCSFLSSECTFNRSRDIIAHMGEESFPWRIIYPMFNRKDVELSDFAFLKTRVPGNLTMSDATFISTIDVNDAAARIYGFPRKNDGYVTEYQDAQLKALPALDDNQRYAGCIRMNVTATAGYSGAPLIVKWKGNMMVVGIFSKIDDYDDSRSTFYAVPTTEITNFNPAEANEQQQYRR